MVGASDKAKNNMPVVVTSIYACTDVGCVRENNEDNFVIADMASGRTYNVPQSVERLAESNKMLMVVSDGMGGEEAGEIASALAVYGLRLELLKESNGLGMSDRLAGAVEHINKLIWNESQTNLERKGMGATLTAVAVEGGRAYVAVVGDSRAYIIRLGKIKQLTTDQSLFEMLVNKGVYNRDNGDAARNIILQSLGGEPEVQVAINAVELCMGDYILLCSDGLSNKLTAEEICKFVSRAPNLESACSIMVELAKKRGGEDNITIVLAKFEGEALPKPSQQGSITKAIDVISVFDPLKGQADRRTKQMVSDNITQSEIEEEEREELFRSTLGLVPLPDHPKRDEMLDDCRKAIELIEGSTDGLKIMAGHVKRLESWLKKHHCKDPSLKKAFVHLEQTIKNVQKIESAARKSASIVERASAGGDKEKVET